MDEFEDFIDHNLDMFRQSSVPNSGGTFFLFTYVKVSFLSYTCMISKRY